MSEQSTQSLERVQTAFVPFALHGKGVGSIYTLPPGVGIEYPPLFEKGIDTVNTPSETSNERNFAFTELNFEPAHQPQGASHV
jgi:hypothetical protein